MLGAIPADVRTLGKKRFHAKEDGTDWLYYGMVPAYTKAMPGAYEQVSPALRDFAARAVVVDSVGL